MSPFAAARLIEIAARWVEREPACRALGVVGSWARGEAGPGSDLDLLVLTTTPERWKENADWLHETGLSAARYSMISAVRAQYGVVFSWHIELDPVALVEITFAGLSWAKRSPIDPGTRRVVADGIEPIVDKDGLLAALQHEVRTKQLR